MEVFVKGEEFTSELTPELVGVFDGLFVQSMILVEVFKMSLASAFLGKGFGDVVSIYLVSYLKQSVSLQEAIELHPPSACQRTLASAG